MIDLSQTTEELAKQVAEAQRVSIDEAVRQALVVQARACGVAEKKLYPSPRRMSVEAMLALGDMITTMPLYDTRSVPSIIDDIHSA